jgi:hypothetical protein
MERERGDCSIPTRIAAREKCISSATATKYLSWRNSIRSVSLFEAPSINAYGRSLEGRSVRGSGARLFVARPGHFLERPVPLSADSSDDDSYHNCKCFDFRRFSVYVVEMTQRSSEFSPTPIAPQTVLKGPLTALLEWQALAQGAYAPNTLRAQKADGAIFQAYCESVGEAYLPAKPHTVRGFIAFQVKAGKKPATIQRYVATISCVHTAAHLHNPCSSEAVRLG